MNNDLKLLEGIAARDPEAFRTLLKDYAPFLIRVAAGFCGTVADAEDVVQEVLIQLYQNPPSLRPDTKLSTWLYRVTANRCIDFLRKRPASEKTISLETALPETEQASLSLGVQLPDASIRSPREQLSQTESVRAAQQAVEGLPESLRIPLLLSAIEGLSHGEIAEILKTSPKAVERRIARAREILKSRLTEYL